MAGVAVRVLLQVVLILGLGLPDPVPTLNLPTVNTLVCSTVEIEERIIAEGFDVPRNPIAEKFGLYDKPSDASPTDGKDP